jgi:thiol-disulfide isomerase/thioredoxin
MKDSTTNPNIYNRDWELLIEKLAAQSKQNLKSAPNSPDYIEFVESMAFALSAYKQYTFPQNPTTSLDNMVEARLFDYDTSLFRDEKSRFAYELSGLQLYLNDQLFYSPALVQSVYALQAKHPKSGNLDFYEPQIAKLKASLEASHQEFEKGKIIGTNYHSFNNLLKRFDGKNLLIDIWATWCHPCIEEFNYRNSILPFIENKQIEVLYISIDKPQWEDRWRQSIKFNKLEGNHFLANAKFIEDMWDAIGDYKGAIPRYVLVDKKGKIFKSTAARPREGSALAEQIKSLVEKAAIEN